MQGVWSNKCCEKEGEEQEASEEVKGLGRLTVESGLDSAGFLFHTQEFATEVLISNFTPFCSIADRFVF